MNRFHFSSFRRPFLLILFTLLPISVSAAPARAPEHEIKAAYLYHFAKFVEWPEPPEASSATFMIGILGDDPFAEYLERMFTGKRISEKEVVFKRLDAVSEAATCQVVYISASQAEDLEAILDTLRGSPVLTVSDMRNFVRRGGMIGFVRTRKNVAFSINQNVAEKSGLKISSQLLKLAKSIIQAVLGTFTVKPLC